MPEPDSHLMTIVGEALEQPDPAARAAHLDRACGGDADLRRRAEALLAAHDAAGRFLEPVPDSAADAATGPFPPSSASASDPARPSPSEAGVILAGRYKLIEVIGEGGMGSVWMAQQTEPVKRTVAVKLIKAGMDSKAVLARFEAERQALALMDHPNIAKVLDAGAIGSDADPSGRLGGVRGDGRPYFVMELVKGIPITRYCDDHRLTPKERLELFVPVCQAIQHAHQKGVIHRDVKPSNVLVALYDDRPVPKVIDFGVAKAAGQALTERTLATGFGAVVGTPEYMSPEQASFNNLDVDTRSDVYALGVLLYELLAGSPPFSKKELEQVGLLEIFRAIREQEPPRPSTKLSTAEALPTLSANRGTEPKQLTSLLRGELDWIVMKALEKDRARRYETASAFAADVQRHLAGEPVQAVPPSAGYRLRKFLNRNKGTVLTASLVALALVVGIVGTTWGLVRADDARREEAAHRQTAERLKAESDAQSRRAREQQRLAEYRAGSVAVDAALQYLSTAGGREGLVRLAATLKSLPPDAAALRQAVVANLLVWGQQTATPYPGVEEPFHAVSPDGRVAIVAPEGDWEVRDTTSWRKRAALSTGGSAEFQLTTWAAFSGDGTRATTVEIPEPGDPTVRVWNTATWKELARIRPTNGMTTLLRINRDGSRLVTNSEDEDYPPRPGSNWVKTVIHLWDGRTGQLVAKLDRPGPRGELRDFSPRGDVVLTTSGRTALLWSAADGRLLHALEGHADDIEFAEFSPSGKWLAVGVAHRVYWWDAEAGVPGGPPVEVAPYLGRGDGDEIVRFAFSAEDVLIVRVWNTHGVSFGRRVGSAVCVRGHARAYDLEAACSDGRFALTDEGHVYALNPLRRLESPPGRRFPPEARLAASGERFLQLGEHLMDLETEKPVGPALNRPDAPLHRTSAPGCVRIVEGRWYYGRFTGHRIVPSPDLNLPDELLMLWARVLARGHLDADTGLFVEDDEATWERNRRELTTRQAAVGEFPFPGPFASDRLFWLRQALGAEHKPEAKLPLADRLVAAEPSWQNYRHRAYVYYLNKRYADAIRDDLKAREVGGQAYDDDNTAESSGGSSSVRVVLSQSESPRAEYELALKWIDAAAPVGTDGTDGRFAIARALALYRLEQYQAALREVARPELRQIARATVVGVAFPFAPAAGAALTERTRDLHDVKMTRIVEALCHHQLGQHEQARQSLSRAREALRDRLLSRPLELYGGSREDNNVIGEALRAVEARE